MQNEGPGAGVRLIGQDPPSKLRLFRLHRSGKTIRFPVSSGLGEEKSQFFSMACNLTTRKIVQADNRAARERERKRVVKEGEGVIERDREAERVKATSKKFGVG